MEDYEVKGIKYVPVAVKTEDYADFCKKYSVTEDASAIEGGYTEKALKAYTKTAEVTADTNGLKVATKMQTEPILLRQERQEAIPVSKMKHRKQSMRQRL